ncbi:MAG: CHAT domain-containing protein, partial [Gemmatimonadaceae bacterium]|nr:CHAT domain-containing protein [Gemmatimonadaceae bacterium]
MTDSSRIVSPGADLAVEGRELVAQVLRTADVVVSYEIFDDAIAVWTMEKNGTLQVRTIFISPDSLALLVGGFRMLLGVDQATRVLAARGDALERGSVAAVAANADWRTAGRRLRQLLLPDSVSALFTKGRQVVIIPAGAIAVVPFTALPDENGDGVLSDVVAIRYAPSIATLVAAENQALSTTQSMLIVSNPTMPQATSASGMRVQLGSLPGAEAEGADVARRLSTTAVKGMAATESMVRQRLPMARVIHIASHGYAYSSEALARNSFIALSPDAKNDGLLTVREILAILR